MLVVVKFGGTSVGDAARIDEAARRIRQIRHDEKADVIVVVSAMGGETDRLLAACDKWGGEWGNHNNQSGKWDNHHNQSRECDNDNQSRECGDNDNQGGECGGKDAAREVDAVLATGEQVCAGLTALALCKLGIHARSFSGRQAGIHTDDAHGKARILSIDTAALRAAVADGIVPVITGFQGRAANGDLTTLGRGGSDTTAVAVAAAMAADECRIYTDVDGVYTTDPRVCKKARLLDLIHFEEMLEMASLGSRVLQPRAVEFAGKYRVPLRVLSARAPGNKSGTLVICNRSNKMEEPIITGIAFSDNEAKITVVRVPDKPGVAGRLLADLGAANINVDMIVQNIAHDGRTDFSFTVGRREFGAALACAKKAGDAIGAESVRGDDGIGKVSVVGVGMRSNAGVAAKMFSALAGGGVNIQMISTSEIKISVVIAEERIADAVNILHEVFELSGAPGGDGGK